MTGPQTPVQDRVRSSSTSDGRQAKAAKPKSKKPARAEAVDGWSSTTDALTSNAFRRIQTGFKSTCFFLPSESLMTPPVAASLDLRTALSLTTVSSLIFKPPP